MLVEGVVALKDIQWEFALTPSIGPWELLAALHNGAKVAETILCGAQAKEGDITPEEALAEVERRMVSSKDVHGDPRFPDYLFGRPIKAFLVSYEVVPGATRRFCLSRTDLYDKDNGEGRCLEIVRALMVDRGILCPSNHCGGPGMACMGCIASGRRW